MNRKRSIIALSLLVTVILLVVILGTRVYCHWLENSNTLESLTSEQSRTYFLKSSRIIVINQPLVLQHDGGKHRIMTKDIGYVIEDWEAIVIVPKLKKVGVK